MNPSAPAHDPRGAPRPLAALCAGLGTMYLAQGVVSGVGSVLVAIMAAQGQSLESQTGLLAWGALPWVLKFVWALVWDRIAPPGHPRRFAGLIGLQLAVAAAFWPLSSGTWAEGAPLAYFALNLAASWQDVAADGVAIDRTPAERRGLVSGVLAGARALGAGWLGGLLLYRWLAEHGVAPTLKGFAIGLTLSALAIVPLRRVLGEGTPPGAEGARAPTPRLRDAARLFATPGRRVALAIASITLLGDGISSAVAADFLQKRAGWSLEALTGELIPLQVAVEVLAFALSAALVDRIGALRSVAVAAATLALAWISFGLAPGLWPSKGAVMGLATVEASARALLLVGVYGFLMRETDARLRATHFVVYMSLLNLPRVLGPQLAPGIFAALGYAGVWIVSGTLELLVVALALAGRRLERHATIHPGDGAHE